MEIDTNALTPADVQRINTQASVLMKEGIRLLEHPQPDATTAALKCFDRALELRRRLPIETSSMLQYGLAACWLNRADALMRLGNSEQIRLALCAYEEAIALLGDLPLHEDALFPRRLAIAHQNRGVALQSQSIPAITEAVQEFSKAIEVLEHEDAAHVNDRVYLLAAVWTNLANAHLAETNSRCEQLAEEAARRAISSISDLETNDVQVAEVGMKARHVLCHAIAQHLSQIADMDSGMSDHIHEATDAADDGLALARHWEKMGVVQFREIALDLFRFGVRVYGKYQPQFLNEFVSENMDPAQSSSSYVESEEMRSVAREAYELCMRNVSSLRKWS